MRVIVAGILVLAIGGPALADVPIAGPKPAAAPSPVPKGIWRADEKRGYEHVQSGMICPETIGVRRRRTVETFDKFGLDVGCDYSGFTYYLTRRTSGGIPEAMAEAKRELVEGEAAHHPRLTAENHEQDKGLDWAEAFYADDNDVSDGIWMADISGWTLEYRVTYPSTDHTRISDEVKSSAMTILQEVGPRLASCAKALPTERRGRPITDKAAVDSASMMTSILGGALAASRSKAQPQEPIFRCAEQAVEQNEVPMLFWRDIRPDGSDALSDEVSVELTDGPLVMSFSSGEPGLLASLSKEKADQPPQWSATIDAGDRTLIFGYFSGRPTINDMRDLFVAVLTGKAKAVGGYSAKGNAITIMTPSK